MIDELLNGTAAATLDGIGNLNAVLEAMPTTVASEAEALLDAGFWPVPLYAPGAMRPGRDEPSEGKDPIGNGWGLARNTPEMLRTTFARNPGAGVGICLGPGRAPGGGWLIDIEGDGPEAEESRLKLFGGEEVETMGWGSARGAHALHSAPGEYLDLMQQAGASKVSGVGNAGVFKLAELPGLEFRIGGPKPDGTIKQVQSACPPTLTTGGVPREWNGCDGLAELPDAALAFMEALAERNAIRDEAPAKPEPAQPSFKIPVTGPLDKLTRARLYAEKLDLSISGEEGHKRAIRAACRIGPGFDLSIEETLSVLEPWSQRCQPPWSPGELLHKVTDAFKINILPLGFLFNKERPGDGQASPVAASAKPMSAKNQAAVEIEYSTLSDEEMGIVPLKSVREGRIEWLWEHRIAKGEMTIVAGEGGLGKSQLLLSIASAVSRAGEWADKSGNAPLGGIIILAAEDSPETTIKPRLIAMGADVDRITILKAKVTIPVPGKKPLVNFMSLQDLEYWRDVFRRRADTTLLIIDPLPSYLGKNVNDSKNNEVRAILEPFIEDIIRPRGISMLTNAHLNKNVDLKSPTHRINGSVAYANLARNVHFVTRDADDPTHRIFSQAKCNNAPDDLPAIGFRVQGVTVDGIDGPIETAIPVFDAETLKGFDLSSSLAGDKGSQGKGGTTGTQQATKVDACARFIVDYLWGQGVGVSVHYGRLIDACGLEGYAGVCSDDTGRWSNPALMSRAIERFNNPEHKPPELAQFEIKKETRSPFGDGPAKAFHLAQLSTDPIDETL